jgi:hypothetical protein
MSDLDTRLAQLVKAERQVAPPSDTSIDEGWVRLAHALVGPLPPGPPDGETGGGGAGERGANEFDNTPTTSSDSPRPRVSDAAVSSPAPVVPLHTGPAPARVGVWVWPAAAIVVVATVTVVTAWRPWSASSETARTEGSRVATVPSTPRDAVEVSLPTTNPSSEVPSKPPATDPAPSTDPRADPGAPQATPVAPPIEEIEPSHAAPAPTRRAHRVEETTTRPGLAEELALVESMRSAFARDDPAEVLTLGKQHRKTFPKGALREERAALEVRASCRLGRADAAKRRDTFLESWPTSAHVERIDRDCATK